MRRRVAERVSKKLATGRVSLLLPDRVDLRQLPFGNANVDCRRLRIADIPIVCTLSDRRTYGVCGDINDVRSNPEPDATWGSR